MANVMSMKSVKNKVHRNGFDLSSRVGFTAKVGEILPVQWKMVYPGETFKFNQANFTRTTPVNTAAYSRIRESFDTFFVPFRLLWDKFPQWIIQTRQPQYAASITSGAVSSGSMPYLTDTDIVNYVLRILKSGTGIRQDINGIDSVSQLWKLLDSLGYGSLLTNHFTISKDGTINVNEFEMPTASTALNIFPLLAYQKIYSDYFRYQQWENSKPYTFNLDFILNDNQSHIDLSSLFINSTGGAYYDDTLFELHYANFPKDYFTGQLPSAQYGDVALAGPVTGNLVFEGSGNAASANALWGNIAGTRRADNFRSGWSQFAVSSSGSALNTSGVSVLAIRQAEALQKWKEITQAAGFDYKSQMKAHWNVNVGNSQSDKCQRVGGFDSNINISEVVNQALTANDPANIAGKGVGSSGSSFTFKNTSNEYGILMTVYHAVPVLDYNSDVFLERELLKVNATDFAIPEFDSIGMQQSYACEFLNISDNVNLTLSGFAPRYAEYKTARDVVRGGFLRAYKDWVSPLSRDFLYNRLGVSGTFNLSYRAFKISPVILNNIFLAQVRQFSAGSDPYDTPASVTFDDDQLIINFMNSCHAVRNFSRDGLPY